MALALDLSLMPDLPPTTAERCKDGIRDDVETDVDCGGGTCERCGLGGRCEAPATGPRDCLSDVCSANQSCVASQCVDGVFNGAETDLDCGGGTCVGCLDGKMCRQASDCASGHCYVNFEFMGYCYSCTPTQCTTPPAAACMAVAGCSAPTNYCRSNVLATSFAVPGSCDANAHCTYSPAQVVACANGCSNGACNTAGPAFCSERQADRNDNNVGYRARYGSVRGRSIGQLQRQRVRRGHTIRQPLRDVAALDA